MKKILICAIACMLAVACSSSSKKNDSDETLTDQYSKYQIVDQEFDNLSVANDGYDRVAPYEDQINNSSYIQSSVARDKNKKPNRDLTVQKTVVDAQGHILSSTSTSSFTDQEVYPDKVGE